MLTLNGPKDVEFCDGLSRRDFMKVGSLSVMGLSVAELLAAQQAEAAAKREMSCIILFLVGGPSHIDTWDLKKENGPFKAIDTAVSGMRISEHLPRLAKRAKDYSIVRSVTSKEADHERATYFLHTGNVPQETVKFPTLGAVASKEWPAPADLPLFVSVGEPYSDPGFLGLEHAPFVVNPDNPTATLAIPDEIKGRFKKRLELLDAMNGEFAKRSDAEAVAEDIKIQKRAIAMMSSKALKAFDIGQEEEKVRAAYGDSPFGRGCLLARRLVENGIRFVEVTLDGWDTHEDNFNQVQALSGALDPAMASLVRELSDRKLLDETLVVWMGEFGRTAEINGTTGRDHQSSAFSVVLAGGGVAGGRVIGESDKIGLEVKDRPVTVPDLFASIFQSFGFDPQKKYQTGEGRPIKLVEKGVVVKELF